MWKNINSFKQKHCVISRSLFFNTVSKAIADEKIGG